MPFTYLSMVHKIRWTFHYIANKITNKQTYEIYMNLLRASLVLTSLNIILQIAASDN